MLNQNIINFTKKDYFNNKQPQLLTPNDNVNEIVLWIWAQRLRVNLYGHVLFTVCHVISKFGKNHLYPS